MTNSHLKAVAVASAAALLLLAGSLYLFATQSAPNPGGNAVRTSTSAGTASAVPTPAALPAKTNINWTPTSVNEILSPGESKTVSVSFTSSKNIQRVSVQVSADLQSLVQVQPQFLDRVRKGQSRVITLTLAPAANAALGTATGTIQLRKEKKDPNDKDEGEEEPGKPLLQSLPVTVNVWQSMPAAQDKLVFKVPSFGRPTQLVRDNQWEGISSLEIQIQDPTSSEYVPVFKLVIHSNPDRLSLSDWFRQQIDINNILTDQHIFSLSQSANGNQVLVLTNALPDAYGQAGGGPVNDLYMISPAHDYVLTIVPAQDNVLYSLGFTSTGLSSLLAQILGTVQFQ